MKTKQLLYLSPELYLIAAAIYYWTLTANTFNPIAITLVSVLLLQLIFKKAISGLLISGIFVIVNLYLVLALISELNEFTSTNQDYYNLLIAGSLFLSINILVGSFMFYKYINKNHQLNPN